MSPETFVAVFGGAFKWFVIECIKKGYTDPLLKNLLAPIADYIEHSFNASKADKELRKAFELIIENCEASSDNDETLALLKKLALSTLISKQKNEMRVQFALELIYFREGAVPSDSLIDLLEWPKSRRKELSTLLGTMRASLGKTQWGPMMTIADGMHTNMEIEGIHKAIEKMSLDWSKVFVEMPDGHYAIRTISVKMKLTEDQVKQIDQEYRKKLIASIENHKFSGTAVNFGFRLPLEEIHFELGFLSLRDQEEHKAIRSKMKKMDLEAQLEFQRERLKERVSDVLQKNQSLVVLGDPGAGKSFYLRFLELMLAKESGVSRLKLDKEFVPLWLRLSDYAKEGGGLSLENFLLEKIMKEYGLSDQLGKFLQVSLEEGNCMVLLDGLDELSRDINTKVTTHSWIVRAVQKFRDSYCKENGNRIVVTSRTDGYWADQLYDFTHVQLSPLNPKDEVGKFLEQWLTAYEKNKDNQITLAMAKNIAENKVNILLPRIQKTNSLLRMAINPLLLTILAYVNDKYGELPNRRIEVYKLATKTLIENWNSAQEDMPDHLKSINLKEKIIIPIMAKLAFWLHEKGEGGTASVDDWESKIETILLEKKSDINSGLLTECFLHHARFTIGILSEYSTNQLGFFHLTFEEYLAARYIAMQDQGTRTDIIKKHWTDPFWKEVLILASAQIGVVDEDENDEKGKVKERRRDEAGTYLLNILRIEPSSPEEMGRPAYLAGSALVDMGMENIDTYTRMSIRDQCVYSAKDVNFETKRFNVARHVSPTMRAECADLADELGYEPDDLYSFVPIPNKEKPDFVMARYPVTNVQYERFLKSENFSNKDLWINFPLFSEPVKEGNRHRLEETTGNDGWDWLQRELKEQEGRNNEGIHYPSYWSTSSLGGRRRNLPVISVSWYVANAYCKWLLNDWDNQIEGNLGIPKPIEIRLPTYKEWAIASKNAGQGAYPWGDLSRKTDIVLFANTWNTKNNWIRPVWMYEQGKSEIYKIMDMSGNVWEWQGSYFDKKRKEFIIRGGSWINDEKAARRDACSKANPDNESYSIGFRIILSLSSK